MIRWQKGDTVEGKVKVAPQSGRKFEHQGIKVELFGQIEIYHERGSFSNFAYVVRELEPAGVLENEAKEYSFEFGLQEMKDESYMGRNVRYE